NNTTINKTVTINNVSVSARSLVAGLAPITQVNNTRVTALASLGHAERPGAAPAVAAEQHVIRLQKVEPAERAERVKQTEQIHRAAQQRRDVESKLLNGGPPHRVTDPPKAGRLD